MATWRKVATFDDDGQVDGDITGVAHGGIDGILTVSKGGTGADSSGFAVGSMLMHNGSEVTTIAPPNAPDQLLVSNDTGGWEWKGINDFHHHDGSYVKIAGNSTITGDLRVLGSLTAGEMEVVTLTELTQVDGANIVLNNNGVAGGDNGGLFLDLDGDSQLDTGDPGILWDDTTDKWQMGKYNEAMYDIGLMNVGSNISSGSAADSAGLLGTDGSGGVYISVD